MGIKQEKMVSIIIPYYNTKEFIKDCLESALSQTYQNIEVIIINDGSNNEDTQFIESLILDKRIKYIKTEINKGVGFSRNKGLEHASGEYVYFLDSDDLLSNNAIGLLLEHINDFSAICGISKNLIRPTDIELSLPNENVGIKLRSVSESFKNGSILNVLFKNDLLKKSGLQFCEDTKGFSDIELILPLMEELKELPQLNVLTYYKRERNDPISNPSLTQRSTDMMTTELVKVYKALKKKPYTSNTHKYLDRLLMDYYREYVTRIFKQDDQFTEFYTLLGSAFRLMDADMIKSQPFFIRRELIHLRKGNELKFKKVLKMHIEGLDLKNALKGFTRLKNYLYKKVLLKLPMKENYIVFESFLGKNYSDSPRNIYEYIIENNLDYKCIWVFNDKQRKIPGNAKIVKRFSLAYYYYHAVSKYWINNMRQPLHLVKREGNVFLETWHGTPLKKLVFDMKEIYSANPRYKRDFYMQSRAWDYLLSPNQYSSDIFRSAFKFDKEMLEFGYPRNDILYSPDKEERATRIKNALGIPKDKKVVLYAPTWRDDDFYESGKYRFELKLDLRKMREELGDEYVVALRMHYFIADDLNIEGLEGFAFNLSKYDDISELYLISDILITDYSSVFFDYANLKRPILFYTYDLDKYRDQLRGFYIDFEKDAPGPLLRTSDQVIDAIKNIEQIKSDYMNNYEAFFEKYCSWHDGKTTEKVVKKVLLSENI